MVMIISLGDPKHIAPDTWRYTPPQGNVLVRVAPFLEGDKPSDFVGLDGGYQVGQLIAETIFRQIPEAEWLKIEKTTFTVRGPDKVDLHARAFHERVLQAFKQAWTTAREDGIEWEGMYSIDPFMVST